MAANSRTSISQGNVKVWIGDRNDYVGEAVTYKFQRLVGKTIMSFLGNSECAAKRIGKYSTSCLHHNSVLHKAERCRHHVKRFKLTEIF